jgi:homocysteine S-methyltransferase
MKMTKPILTDGGLETTLIYDHGIKLPHFAAFVLLNKPYYQKVIMNYYQDYLKLAKKHKTGFILESATWRASSDWGYKLGYEPKELSKLNKLAIHQLHNLRNQYAEDLEEILVSGCIGPRGDGYSIEKYMSVDVAKEYHGHQIAAFKTADADMCSALTINYVNEGLGIALAAKESDLPVVISFTVETDGKLPSGESLKEGIERIDQATGNYPMYYMVNCAHPSHFSDEFGADNEWKKRISGVRANASSKSHAELNESTEIDAGDREELAKWYKVMKEQLPNLNVLGGCCGTGADHIEAICEEVINTN